MLDGLLGKDQLRDRIEELERERDEIRDRFRDQVEAAEDRCASVSRDYQEAREEVSQLEDRIAGLEGELQETQCEDSVTHMREEVVRGARVNDLIDRLESFTAPVGVHSAFVEDTVPDRMQELLGEQAAVVANISPCLVYVDDLGIMSVAVRPPLPPDPFYTVGDEAEVDSSWFYPEGEFSVAVIRSDVFAYGEYDGDERLSCDGFTSNVKSDHSKGGFSQARFERIRDEQITDHVEKCRDALRDAGDPLYVAGDERLIAEFADEATVTVASDASGDPESALSEAVDDFWAVQVFSL